MRNLAVHWSEGMFLRPHHFQAADRHWSELIATSSQWDNAYNYGLRRCELSLEALANYQVQVAHLECRLGDGTIFSAGPELGRRDLKAAFADHAEATVFLAVPKSVLGRTNVARDGAREPARYVSQAVALQDEAAGGNDQEILLLRLDGRLMLSTEDLHGLEALPIARVRRAGAAEATPELDDYIPPLVSIDAWPPLSIGIVRAIYDVIGEKIEVLAGRVRQRGITLASPDPGDLDDLLMLHALNQAQATLHPLTFARGVHPLTAYVELCRVVGGLSIFDPQRVVGEIPAYDHDDLSRIFRWVKLRIEQLLGSRKQLQYEQRFFVGTERGLQVDIDPRWLHAGWDWYVGVNGKNVPDRLVRELLQPGKLDWKMGSSHQVDVIFKHGVPGVQHVELPSAPRALPSHQGWSYYEISREGNAWKDVFATQTLALRFRTELIGNLEGLPGQRNLEVVLPDKRAVLQFALFAVPRVES
ncbi:MAG: type VI secretion system baseplate subunit TssK [Planctomycetota bacterium]|nr:MAG: type VI secretion system baseplate subunit TssK [Planctomycetota bacterium]